MGKTVFVAVAVGIDVAVAVAVGSIGVGVELGVEVSITGTAEDARNVPASHNPRMTASPTAARPSARRLQSVPFDLPDCLRGVVFSSSMEVDNSGFGPLAGSSEPDSAKGVGRRSKIFSIR